VRTLGGSFNVGALERVFHHGRDTIPRGKGSAGSFASNKHVIGVDVRGAAFQVSEQRVADILREWQSYLVSSFPYHLQRAVVPVDVAEAHTRYIPGTQPQPHQHQYDRPVPKAPMICAITGGNEPIYLLRGQTAGQPREAPVGHGGYGESKVIASFSEEVEKPQKGPEGGNQFLGCRNAALVGTFQ
jgi:hypothetical protein